MYYGVAASEGIAIGQAYILKKREFAVGKELPTGAEEQEVGRFLQALGKARGELSEVAQRVMREVGETEAAIFEAHICLLEDEELIGGVVSRIRDGNTAAWSVLDFFALYREMFAAMEDAYMQERAEDMTDLAARLVSCLEGDCGNPLDALTEPVILVAAELTPSDTVHLSKELVLGFVIAAGGKTSHAAIVARGRGIPAVAGLQGIIDKVKDGDLVIVDGGAGLVHVNPDQATLEGYRCVQATLNENRDRIAAAAALPAITKDGQVIEVHANLGAAGETSLALAGGADGVGLFRTELLFMDRPAMPDEEEQYQAYRQAVEGMSGRPVIFRTLDIGGDKHLPYLDLPAEANPFLGVRAIRLCLNRPELFKTQLRAILRASAHGNVWLMYPMVAKLQEMRAANELLAECKRELSLAGMAFDAELKVGMMVEVPAVAAAADIFIKQADFFSIGTNDLVQYTLAADRMNENLDYLYDPLHPAVLRLINNVIKAGKAAGKPVGMCGEMAADPLAAIVLAGLGLTEFSASPASVAAIKNIIRSIDLREARELADKALALDDGGEIRQLVQDKMRQWGI